MRLLQLNIWQGRLMRGQTLSFIKNCGADILCLQEVYSCNYSIANPDMFDSLEQMQKALGYGYVFFAPTVAFDVYGTEVKMGNAIISKYPITNKQTVFTNESFTKFDARNQTPKNIRNAQICQITAHGKTFTVSNHHGYWAPSGTGSPEAESKMQIWVDALKQGTTPIIASGDLNVIPASNAMRPFDGFLRNLTQEHDIPTTLSQLGIVKDVACDHILVSEGINVASFTVCEELVSDHKALLLDFEVA